MRPITYGTACRSYPKRDRARESISDVSFYRWRKALAAQGAGGALVVQESSPGFVSLGTVNARPLRERLELR